MAFSADIIDQVRQANDIVQVVQQSVPLKRAGANWKGLCPFHAEKSPSFNVHPAKQIYHCFGCGEGGDVFSFVQKTQKIGFGEALRQLADRAGVALPDEAQDEVGRAEQEKRRKDETQQLELLELAGAWFRRNLEEGGEGAQARIDAEGRGLDLASRERFGLGYAPADGGALVRAAAKKGYSAEALVGVGLAITNERGTYARFRARLMFPIHDPKGRLVGFGGRILGPGEPKYLNSPEGPLFSKGRLLYPWPQAREALGKQRQALICEGYMDAIACHQGGLTQALASLGTALTAEHAKLLKRYVSDVVLIFDADAAGLRAALRAAEPLSAAGLGVKVARLKDAKDPDELLRKHGPEALRAAVESAEPILRFSASTARDLAGTDLSPSAKRGLMLELFPLLQSFGSLAEKDAATKDLAQELGFDLDVVRQEFSLWLAQGSSRPAQAPPGAPAQARVAMPVRASEGLLKVERELLALLAAHHELVASAKQELPEPAFCSAELQAAAKLLWKAPDGVVLLLEDDGSEDYQLGDALLSDLVQRQLPQLVPAEESLRELLQRRQELLLADKLTQARLSLRQAEGHAGPSAPLLKEIQALEQAVQDLRRERRERGLAPRKEEA